MPASFPRAPSLESATARARWSAGAFAAGSRVAHSSDSSDEFGVKPRDVKPTSPITPEKDENADTHGEREMGRWSQGRQGQLQRRDRPGWSIQLQLAVRVRRRLESRGVARRRRSGVLQHGLAAANLEKNGTPPTSVETTALVHDREGQRRADDHAHRARGAGRCAEPSTRRRCSGSPTRRPKPARCRARFAATCRLQRRRDSFSRSPSPSPTMPNVTWYSWDQIPRETVSPLLDRKLITGDRMMLAHVYLKKGCIVPKHHARERAAHVHPRGCAPLLDRRRRIAGARSSAPARCCTFRQTCRTKPKRSRTRSTWTSSIRRGRTG